MLTFIAFLLGSLIVVINTIRPKNHGIMDFFGFLSVIYFVLFVICPIFINYSTYGSMSQSELAWLRINTLDQSSLVYAEIFAFAGYILVFFGYSWSSSIVTALFDPQGPSFVPPDAQRKRLFSKKRLLWAGSLLWLVGGLSLLVYASKVGGFFDLIKYAGAMRSGEGPVLTRFGFLKSVSTLLLTASFIYYALWKDFKEESRRWLRCGLFLVTFLMSIILLYHMAGRLRLFTYIMTFPAVGMMIRGRLKIRTVAFGLVLSVMVVLFGKQIFHLLIDPETNSRRFDLLGSENTSTLAIIISEFAFPLATIANTVCYAVPSQIPYRYFVDFPLAIIYLIPKRLFEIEELPVTANSLNGDQFGGPIPIDLISLGYCSLGVIGVVILLLLFGASLRLADRIFANQDEIIVEVFRVSWMFFLGFRIMYGDPVNSLKAGFYLVVGTIALLLIKGRGSPRETTEFRTA